MILRIKRTKDRKEDIHFLFCIHSPRSLLSPHIPHTKQLHPVYFQQLCTSKGQQTWETFSACFLIQFYEASTFALLLPHAKLFTASDFMGNDNKTAL